MSCAIFTFMGLYALLLGKSNRWLIGASFTAAVLLFFVAAFGAWQEEHEAKLKEIARTQQPDVAIIWDWPADEKMAKSLIGGTEKFILVENRSDRYVYNVQIDSVKLHQELVFDLINEIAPAKQHAALGRWDGRSSEQTNYIYFFGNGDNEKKMLTNRWIYKKIHNRGISDSFIKVPMAVTYGSSGIKWRCEFDFVYAPGDESLFVRKLGQRI